MGVVQWHYGTTMENYEQSITAVCIVIYWVLYCNMRIETTPPHPKLQSILD